MSANTRLFRSIGSIQTYLPIHNWILFFLYITWGLLKQTKDITIFTLWWFFVILTTNPSWIGLPDIGVVTNFAIFNAFYIPALVVIGSAFVWIPIINQMPAEIDSQINKGKLTKLLLPSLLLLIICVFGPWGLSKRIIDLNISAYDLITRSDLPAMELIRDNTALDDNFLVNLFFA